MACYFWKLLNAGAPIGPPESTCSSCGSTVPEQCGWILLPGWNMDMGCPNCGAGAMPLSALPSSKDEISQEEWEQAEIDEALSRNPTHHT